MFLAIIFLAILVVVIASGMWGLYYYVVLPGMQDEPWRVAPPGYHYRRCKTCDYTYMVSSDYPGPDPGCPACGDEWHTETLWLQHKRIKGKWQDVTMLPPRIEKPAPRVDPVTEQIIRMNQQLHNRGIQLHTDLRKIQQHTTSIRAQVHRMPVPAELDHLSRHSALYEPTLEADD